jgi:hypothetical protein
MHHPPQRHLTRQNDVNCPQAGPLNSPWDDLPQADQGNPVANAGA